MNFVYCFYLFQINIFKLVGGNTPHIMIRNILKKAVTNVLAQDYNWTGKNTNSFKDLGLTTIIIRKLIFKKIEINLFLFKSNFLIKCKDLFKTCYICIYLI